MELLFLALPFVTSSLMFFYKKVATLSMFDNGAAARPWLRALLILTSIAGVVATALLNGQPLNPDSISTLVQLLFGTAANAYLSHAFYRSVAESQRVAR